MRTGSRTTMIRARDTEDMMDGFRMGVMDMGMTHMDNNSSSITTMDTIRTTDAKTKTRCGDPIRPEPTRFEAEH